MNPNNPTDLATQAADNSPAEFLSLRVRLRSDLSVIHHDVSSVKLEDPIRGKFFRIGRHEHAFIHLLDGERTVQEAIDMLNRVYQRPDGSPTAEQFDPYTPEVANSILNWLTNNNLLVSDAQGNALRLAATANRIRTQKRFGLLNLVSLKISLGNPTPLLRRITPLVSRAFSLTAFFIWLSVMFWAAQLLISDHQRFADASLGILSSGRWIWLLVCWLALKIVHEAAHGIACIKYGGEVREAGVLFLLFTPMAFVDVTSSWRFKSRKQRMMVAAAGMYCELFVAAIAGIVWAHIQPGVTSDICYNLVIMAGLTTILFNANPLMRFDGYYLLSDLLEITNLYTKSQTWLTELVRNVAFGFPRSECDETGWRRIVVKNYAVAAYCWKTLLTAGLLIAASCLFGGAGWMLALVGGLFWVAIPLNAQIQHTRNLAKTYSVNWRRFAIASGCLTACLAAGIFFLAAPRTATSPAMVRIHDQQTVRAPADGFIESIRVCDGQQVVKGQELIVLRNPELNVRVAATKSAIAQAEVQSRMHRQKGELAMYQAELLKLESLRNQLHELQTQSEELILRAPADGIINRRNLENLAGRFVHRGDSIAMLGDPNLAEILVSIDQQKVDSIEEIVGNPVRVLLPGVGLMRGQVTHITQRASDVPPGDEWCVPQGGPLAVRVQDNPAAGESSQYRLLAPRIQATVALDQLENVQLKSGQIGKAFIHTQRQSLASFLYLSAQQWVRNKVAMSIGT